MGELKTRVISWKEIDLFVDKLSKDINESGFHPDAIIGIARGGLVPAALLSDKLGAIPLYVIKTEHWPQPGKSIGVVKITYSFSTNLVGKKVLLVDDISDSGDSFKAAIAHVRKENMPDEIRTAALQFANEKSTLKPDYYAEDKPEGVWITYPWTREEDRIAIEKMKREDCA